MALLDFLKGRKKINSLLAAGALFTGAISASAAEETEQTPISKKQSATQPISNLNQLLNVQKKVDAICENIVKAELKEREADVPHLYLDSRGILTVGIGLNVNDYKSFSQLDFLDSNGKKIDEKAKKAYYAQIMVFKSTQQKKGFNYKSSYYDKYFRIRPTEESLQKMFSTRVANSVNEVRKQVGTEAYYNLHVQAAAEVVMMNYNMGAARFNPKKFPKFFGAVKAGNYVEMSKQCHVKGVSDARNKKVADMFSTIGTLRWTNIGTRLRVAMEQEQLKLAMNVQR